MTGAGVDVEAERVERIRAAQVSAVGTAFVRFRALLAVPAAALAFGAMVAAGVAPRQLAAVATGLTLTGGFFVAEALRARARPVTGRWLAASLLATLAALAFACVATGGASSPMVPLLFAPTVTTFAAFGRGRASLAAAALFAAVAVALAALPPGVPFEPLPAPLRRALLAHFALVSAALLYASAASLSDAFARQAALLDRMREDVLAESRARSRTLDAVGARVAHELKNPLTAIKGLAALVARCATDEREKKRLEVLEGEVARMESILGEWLTFSRPLEDVAPAPADLAELARDVAAVLEARAASAGVTLTAAGPPLACRVDARRVKAALLNLAANALEATPRGGRVALAWEADGAVARVTVTDTGAGMSPEALSRVGTAFYTTREGGTGLGVLLARGAFEQHGGSLRFESATGEGTRAVGELPRGAEEAG